MTKPWLPFEEVYPDATIEQIVDHLGLDLKGNGPVYRCECPVHGGNRSLCVTPSKRHEKSGSMGVYFCQAEGKGGDRISLLAHVMEIGQQDAAYYIRECFGGGTGMTVTGKLVTSTPVPPNTNRLAPPAFDPEKFKAKLAYTDQVKQLGLSEVEAKEAFIGEVRGQLHIPRIYASGVIAGWWKLVDGKLVPPATWLPDAGNVVKLRRA